MPPLPPLSLVKEITLEILLPAVGTSAVLFYLWLRLLGPRSAFSGSAVALFAGFVVANHIKGTLPLLRDEQQDLHRLTWSAAVALGVGLIARLPRFAVLGWCLRIGGAALAAWILLPPPGEGESWPAWLPWALAGVILAEWVVAELSSLPDSPAGAMSFAVAGVGAAIVLLHAHFARGTEGGLLLACAMAGVAGIAWWRWADAGGVAPAGAVLLPGLLFVGQTTTYSEVPLRCYLLVGLAPLGMAPFLLPLVQRLAGARLGLLRVVFVLVPVIIAVVLAMRVEEVEF